MRKYKLGDRVLLDDREYLIARVGPSDYRLIRLDSGDRDNDKPLPSAQVDWDGLHIFTARSFASGHYKIREGRDVVTKDLLFCLYPDGSVADFTEVWKAGDHFRVGDRYFHLVSTATGKWNLVSDHRLIGRAFGKRTDYVDTKEIVCALRRAGYQGHLVDEETGTTLGKIA